LTSIQTTEKVRIWRKFGRFHDNENSYCGFTS